MREAEARPCVGQGTWHAQAHVLVVAVLVWVSSHRRPGLIEPQHDLGWKGP